MGIAPSTAAPATVTRETPMPLAILGWEGGGSYAPAHALQAGRPANIRINRRTGCIAAGLGNDVALSSALPVYVPPDM